MIFALELVKAFYISKRNDIRLVKRSNKVSLR